MDWLVRDLLAPPPDLDPRAQQPPPKRTSSGFGSHLRVTNLLSFSAEEGSAFAGCWPGYVAVSPFVNFQLNGIVTDDTDVPASTTLKEIRCDSDGCFVKAGSAYGGRGGGGQMRVICVEAEQHTVKEGTSVKTLRANELTAWSVCPDYYTAIGIGRIVVGPGGLIDHIECEDFMGTGRCRARCTFGRCLDVRARCSTWDGIAPGVLQQGGGEYVVDPTHLFDGSPPDEWTLPSRCPEADGGREIGLKRLLVHNRKCKSASLVAPSAGSSATLSFDGIAVSDLSCEVGGACLVVFDSFLNVTSSTNYLSPLNAGQLASDLSSLPIGNVSMLALPDAANWASLTEAILLLGGFVTHPPEPEGGTLTLFGQKAVDGDNAEEWSFRVHDHSTSALETTLCESTPQYGVNSITCEQGSGCKAYCIGKSCSIQTMCLLPKQGLTETTGNPFRGVPVDTRSGPRRRTTRRRSMNLFEMESGSSEVAGRLDEDAHQEVVEDREVAGPLDEDALAISVDADASSPLDAEVRVDPESSEAAGPLDEDAHLDLVEDREVAGPLDEDAHSERIQAMDAAAQLRHSLASGEAVHVAAMDGRAYPSGFWRHAVTQQSQNSEAMLQLIEQQARMVQQLLSELGEADAGASSATIEA